MLKQPIAIVGMECNLPGAESVKDFWENMCAKKRGTIKLAGSDNAGLHISVGYLDGFDCFDYQYFKMGKREATLIDPQHRLFISVVAKALENYKGESFTTPHFGDKVGVFSSCPMNTYLNNTRDTFDSSLHTISGLQSTLQNDKDYLALRTANVLNLTGPAVDMQTSCCSSATAVHYACLSLINNDCDIAVAGGSTLMVPQLRPYQYIEGSIFSSDGDCNPFTSSAKGTVHGNGCAVVVLKRLSDAERDNDKVFGIIISSAINNNGNRQEGITAPSVEGWCEVINEATRDIDINTIGIIETHGTGTILGDAVESEALKRAFSAKTKTRGFCSIGTAKSHIGHLEAACGVINVIKASLSLSEELITSDIYENTEPINFTGSPFYISRETEQWPRNPQTIRRVSVNSSGMGGTNVHMVLEEAPIKLSAKLSDMKNLFGQYNPLPCWHEEYANNPDMYLGLKIKDTIDEIIYEIAININSFKWIKDHKLAGVPIIPGTYFVHLLTHYANKLDETKKWMLKNVEISERLAIGTDSVSLRTTLQRRGNQWSIKIESRNKDSWEAKLHAAAVISESDGLIPQQSLPELIRGRQEALNVTRVYKNQISIGLYHGLCFQKMRHAVKTPEGLLGVITDFEGHLRSQTDREVCLLDSCLQLFRFVHGQNEISENSGYLLTSFEKINISEINWKHWKGFWCLAKHRAESKEKSFITDFYFYSENGHKVGEILGAREIGVGLANRDFDGQTATSSAEVNQLSKKSTPSKEYIVLRLKDLIAETIGSTQGQISSTDTLGTLGVDSFSTLDLSIEIQKVLNSSVDFLDEMQVDSTVEEIAAQIFAKLSAKES